MVTKETSGVGSMLHMAIESRNCWFVRYCPSVTAMEYMKGRVVYYTIYK